MGNWSNAAGRKIVNVRLANDGLSARQSPRLSAIQNHGNPKVSAGAHGIAAGPNPIKSVAQKASAVFLILLLRTEFVPPRRRLKPSAPPQKHFARVSTATPPSLVTPGNALRPGS